MNSIGKICDVAPGKTPAKASYASAGDVKIVKFRDVLESGTVDYTNDEEGWLDVRYANDSDLVDLQPETILLTNAAHSVEHIGKKVAYVERTPNIARRVCYVGELTGIRAKVDANYLIQWIYYWLQTNQAKASIARAVEGAHLVPRQFKRIALPNVTTAEQARQLLLFSKIDDTITKARTELDATREMKRSLLETLFSEGLARYRTGWKDTKLGRIPANWQVKRVKDVLIEKPTNGYSPQSNPEPPGTKTLNVACVRHGDCDVSKASYVDIDNVVIQSLQVQLGDFFVLRGNGNRDYIGIGGVVRDAICEPMIYSDLLFRLRFKEFEAEPQFIPCLWQTQAFLHRLQAKAKSGSGLWKIGKRDIENEMCALPEKEEQREMVAIIESATKVCNEAMKKVDALREVKRSLLQNLLTGKIRIPEGFVHA